jgi:hypothetical protein
MNVVLKTLGGLLGLVAVLVLAVFIGARFSDGPLEIIAGGPFTSGELVAGPEPDWGFVHDIQEVQFQLLDPERSRTTWIVDHDGKAYIPSGYMTSWWGKIWKKWPIEAEKDPRTLLRVGDKLYERTLVRVEAGPTADAIVAELSRKYMGGTADPGDMVSSGSLWIFELAPRR